MNNGDGRYFYGILGNKNRLEFGPIGIGKREDVVYTLPYQDISAIISSSPIVKYPVTREYTLEHTNVLDTAAEEGTVLPARFCTIGENEDLIVEKVLKPRYDEFVDLLQKMNGKIELRVRARWTNMDDVFAEVVQEDRDIKSLKESLLTYHLNNPGHRRTRSIRTQPETPESPMSSHKKPGLGVD